MLRRAIGAQRHDLPFWIDRCIHYAYAHGRTDKMNSRGRFALKECQATTKTVYVDNIMFSQNFPIKGKVKLNFNIFTTDKMNRRGCFALKEYQATTKTVYVDNIMFFPKLPH